MSVNSRARAASSSTARRAGGGIAARGGGGAIAQPAATNAARTTRLLRSFRAIRLRAATAVLHVVELLLHAVGRGVDLDGLLPHRHRLVVQAILHVRITEMLEDDRVFLRALDRALELAQRFLVLALLVERPAETVDEVAVVRLELDRLA